MGRHGDDPKGVGSGLNQSVCLAHTAIAWPWVRTSRPTPTGCSESCARTAPDRVISTVDPQARHGHKGSARGFNGCKGHIAVDPDSEIITATDVAPGNSGDAESTVGLLADILPSEAEGGAGARVFGDAAYAAGGLLKRLGDNGIHNGVKVQPSSAVRGHFSKAAPAAATSPVPTACMKREPQAEGHRRQATPLVARENWPGRAPLPGLPALFRFWRHRENPAVRLPRLPPHSAPQRSRGVGR